MNAHQSSEEHVGDPPFPGRPRRAGSRRVLPEDSTGISPRLIRARGRIALVGRDERPAASARTPRNRAGLAVGEPRGRQGRPTSRALDLLQADTPAELRRELGRLRHLEGEDPRLHAHGGCPAPGGRAEEALAAPARAAPGPRPRSSRLALRTPPTPWRRERGGSGEAAPRPRRSRRRLSPGRPRSHTRERSAARSSPPPRTRRPGQTPPSRTSSRPAPGTGGRAGSRSPRSGPRAGDRRADHKRGWRRPGSRRRQRGAA